MRLAYPAGFLLGSLLLGQAPGDAVADKMLARVDRAKWGARYVASKSATCQPSIPSQAIQATDQWSEHCVSRADELLEESFFYAFDESSGPVRLRVDVRPEIALSGDVTRALSERLTRRFGAATHGPEMFEIGFRSIRHGEAVAGEHWSSGKFHYFVHQNLSASMPMGVRNGVELIVFDDRLFKERGKDDFIQKADVLFRPEPPSRPFLQQQLGDSYVRLIDAAWKTHPEQQSLALQTSHEAMDLLRRASRAPHEERAMLLLAANGLVAKLSMLFWEIDATGGHELAYAGAVRTRLTSFGVKLGSILHDGGLAYHQDLLWRVWREFPDTEAGELAFLELQQRGWDTNPGIGCPANPDLFRDVIARGEAFLAQHPATRFRKEVLFTLAVANESWWSIAHAKADDQWTGAIPYPRRDINRQHAATARERAINYYQEIVNLAPESPEAASALRRLPRLKLGLDTGQRRFFCSYC